ncbi:MAG: hypothetical protein RL071_3931 [Pseudomonadota bacterium]
MSRDPRPWPLDAAHALLTLAVLALIALPSRASASARTECETDSRMTFTVIDGTGAIVSYLVPGVFDAGLSCPASFERTGYRDVDGDGYADRAAGVCCFEQGNSFSVVSATPTFVGYSATLVSAAADCDDNDAAVEDTQTWFQDGDDDGYGLAGTGLSACAAPVGYTGNNTDCDDTNASVNPALSAYPDVDLDGYGDASAVGIPTCPGGLPAGRVSNALDCDDRDDGVYTGAAEVCDGVDTDCSGGGALPASEQDDDGDGYVECDTATSSVWRGRGAPRGGGDCDDVHATVHPGAVELCDGVYNDCNDAPGTWSTASVPPDEADADGDGTVECLRSSTVPWLSSTEPTPTSGCDCDDADVASYTGGAAEVCDGRYNECSNRTRWTTTYACAFRASASTEPANERDDDGDQYVECSFGAVAWNPADPTNVAIGGDDCDDNNRNSYPGASEVCDGVPNDCSTAVTPVDEVDNDADGYVECIRTGAGAWRGSGAPAGGGDCDDAAPLTRPQVEGSSPLCMTDTDGDGFGDVAAAAPAVAGTDCDDANPAINPDASETCETAYDDDCDGSPNTEDGAPIPGGGSILGARALYRDADLDGFGELGGEVFYSCAPEDGFASSASDCDDANASVYPGAPELCNLVDDDCDGSLDEPEGLDEAISGCVGMYRDRDGDAYGDRDAVACLCLGGGASTAEADGFTYVLAAGDCDDGDDRTKPLSCADGINNDPDQDSLIDENDPDCQYGLTEDGSEVELPLEYLDGNDNDCDGFLPVVELDCDDDGSMPRLPQPRPWVTQAAQIGLGDCDAGVDASVTDISDALTCWDNAALEIVCDRRSKLWTFRYDLSDDGHAGRYTQGKRVYAVTGSCLREGDCDDQCASRCPGASESCDGLDNDCSDIFIGSVDDEGGRIGIPATLDPDRAVGGTVSVNELDLDGDDFVNCNDFLSNDDEVYRTGASCADALTDAALLTDCNDYCVFTTPVAEERCNSFLDLCDSEEPEGVDRDGDGFRTCGAWSAVDGDELAEDIFLVVWAGLVDVDDGLAARRTPPPDTATATDSGGATGDSAGATDTSAVDPDAPGGTRDQEVAIIPVIPPRPHPEDPTRPVECDQPLYDAIYARLEPTQGPDRTKVLLTEIMAGERDATDLLALCPLATPGNGVEEAGGACFTVRLTLRSSDDDDLHTRFIVGVDSRSAITDDCYPHAEQFMTRAVWSQRRIEAARRVSVEWGCYDLFGRSCEESAGKVPRTGLLDERALEPKTPLLSDEFIWWQELLRYDPQVLVNSSVVSCWGDPTIDEGLDGIESASGGDCNDEQRLSNRDAVEGPGDMLGWFGDTTASCETCLDGFDNNCDGNIDCEDPACAACFVGQGLGCGGGAESTCRGNGCAAAELDERAPWRRWPAAVLALVAAAALRRPRSRA